MHGKFFATSAVFCCYSRALQGSVIEAADTLGASDAAVGLQLAFAPVPSGEGHLSEGALIVLGDTPVSPSVLSATTDGPPSSARGSG